MRRSLLVGAAATALVLSATGAASATEVAPVPSCAEASLALTDASTAHRAAVQADEAAAVARTADEAATGARAAALAHPEWPDATEPDATERARILAALPGNTALEQSRTERVALIDVAIIATAEAGETDAGELRAAADETDVDALASELGAAQEVYNVACTPAPAPVAPAPAVPGDLDCIDLPASDGRTAQDVLSADMSDPHGLDYDGDGVACESDDHDGALAQVPVVPVGGVQTGGGPA